MVGGVRRISSIRHQVPLFSKPRHKRLAVGTIREAGMTQAAIEAAPAQPTPAGQPVDRDRDGASDEALVADELLVEEVSIDGMCGVY